MAGKDARQQPRRRPGISEIEHVTGLPAAADAKTPYPPQPRAEMLDLSPQRPQGSGGGQNILALEQAADLGFPQRQGTEHQGAVRDGFVARRTNPAVQTGGG